MMVCKIHLSLLLSILAMLPACGDAQVNNQNAQNDTVQTRSDKMRIQIILGSTRQGRSSDKIAHELKQVADKRTDLIFEIVDLRDYNLPFFNDAIAPASQKEITDPLVKRWSDKIKQADGYIIIVPEYNSGYPGVLKNALDSLYKEWNNKPVAFVGYSGGPTGGASAVAQLHQVALGLEMVPVDMAINIPSSWKAFDTKGKLVKENISDDLNVIIDQLKAKRIKE